MSTNLIEIQKHIGGLDYPVSREDLIRRAQEEGASTEMLEALRSLPPEHVNSPMHVSEAISELR